MTPEELAAAAAHSVTSSLGTALHTLRLLRAQAQVTPLPHPHLPRTPPVESEVTPADPAHHSDEPAQP